MSGGVEKIGSNIGACKSTHGQHPSIPYRPTHGHCSLCLAEVKTLEQFKAISSSTSSSLFPERLPPCPIEGQDLKANYRLSTHCPAMAAEGTLWDKQLNKLLSYRKDPPMTSPNSKEVSDTTWQIMEQNLDELAGFAYKHKGLQPNLDLVLQPPLVAAYLSFKRARGNNDSTLLRAAQQLSLAVPFVQGGKCPQAKVLPTSLGQQVQNWYTTVKAHLRGQAAPSTRKSAVSLPEQWEYAEQQWQGIMEKLEVSVARLLASPWHFACKHCPPCICDAIGQPCNVGHPCHSCRPPMAP